MHRHANQHRKYAAVFIDINRRETLPEEASIHTAEITTIKIALKKIHKREDEMQSVEYNKENRPILN